MYLFCELIKHRINSFLPETVHVFVLKEKIIAVGLHMCLHLIYFVVFMYSEQDGGNFCSKCSHCHS